MGFIVTTDKDRSDQHGFHCDHRQKTGLINMGFIVTTDKDRSDQHGFHCDHRQRQV